MANGNGFRGLIKHYLNPLHVYCRLLDIGLSEKTASSFCRRYEKALGSYFRDNGKKVNGWDNEGHNGIRASLRKHRISEFLLDSPYNKGECLTLDDLPPAEHIDPSYQYNRALLS
jgi:hypothetical protein